MFYLKHLKGRFFDKQNDDVDRYTTNYECNEFLDDTDRAIFERMKRDNPRKFAVAGLGEWGVSEGLVFENWEIKQFDVNNIGIFEDKDGNKTDEQWKYRHIFGLDYGYTNDPTAFIAAAVNPIDKVAYIYDEHYQRRMLNSDIAEMIRSKGFAKERIRADSAEPKSNDDLHRMGISRIMPATKGKDSITNGIAQIQEYKLIVHPSCKNAIAELSSYCYLKDKMGNATNKPSDNDNHLMDALRYAFEDIKLFKPIGPDDEKKRYRAEHSSTRIMMAEDMKGGWS